MFHVKWIQKALDELASIWVQAESSLRKSITASTNVLDAELRTDPFRQSESRDNEERVLFVYPLAVQFEVDRQKRAVFVLHVWRFRRLGE
jgi:hypothetical protein